MNPPNQPLQGVAAGMARPQQHPFHQGMVPQQQHMNFRPQFQQQMQLQPQQLMPIIQQQSQQQPCHPSFQNQQQPFIQQASNSNSTLQHHHHQIPSGYPAYALPGNVVDSSSQTRFQYPKNDNSQKFLQHQQQQYSQMSTQNPGQYQSAVNYGSFHSADSATVCAPNQLHVYGQVPSNHGSVMISSGSQNFPHQHCGQPQHVVMPNTQMIQARSRPPYPGNSVAPSIPNEALGYSSVNSGQVSVMPGHYQVMPAGPRPTRPVPPLQGELASQQPFPPQYQGDLMKNRAESLRPVRDAPRILSPRMTVASQAVRMQQHQHTLPPTPIRMQPRPLHEQRFMVAQVQQHQPPFIQVSQPSVQSNIPISNAGGGRVMAVSMQPQRPIPYQHVQRPFYPNQQNLAMRNPTRFVPNRFPDPQSQNPPNNAIPQFQGNHFGHPVMVSNQVRNPRMTLSLQTTSEEPMQPSAAVMVVASTLAVSSGNMANLVSNSPSSSTLSVVSGCQSMPGLTEVIPNSQSESEVTPEKRVKVPWGWKRLILSEKIVYCSPSGIHLNSKDEVKDYLLTEGTCKCGLECPMQIDELFDYDRSKISEEPEFPVSPPSPRRFCSHKKALSVLSSYDKTPSFMNRISHTHNPTVSLKGRRGRVKKQKNSKEDDEETKKLKELEQQRIDEIINQQKKEYEEQLAEGTLQPLKRNKRKESTESKRTENEEDPEHSEDNSRSTSALSNRRISMDSKSISSIDSETSEALSKRDSTSEKNLEIRRLSATDEGDKILNHAWDSPEKDKEANKTPLEMVENIVSNIEIPKKSETDSSSVSDTSSPIPTSGKAGKTKKLPINNGLLGKTTSVPLSQPCSVSGQVSWTSNNAKMSALPQPSVSQQVMVANGSRAIVPVSTLQPGSIPSVQPVVQLVNTVNGPMLMQAVPMNNQGLLQMVQPTQPQPIAPAPATSSEPKISPTESKKGGKKKKAATLQPKSTSIPVLMPQQANTSSGQQILTINNPSPGSSFSPGSTLLPQPANFVINANGQMMAANVPGNQMILAAQNGSALVSVPTLPQAGVILNQLPDGTLYQVQNITTPMYGGPLVATAAAGSPGGVGGSATFIVTPQGIMQAVSQPSPVQGAVTVSPVLITNTSSATSPHQSSSSPLLIRTTQPSLQSPILSRMGATLSPSRYQKSASLSSRPSPAKNEKKQNDDSESEDDDSNDDGENSSEDSDSSSSSSEDESEQLIKGSGLLRHSPSSQPSTSKTRKVSSEGAKTKRDHSRKLQSNQVDSSGLKATPPHSGSGGEGGDPHGALNDSLDTSGSSSSSKATSSTSKRASRKRKRNIEELLREEEQAKSDAESDGIPNHSGTVSFSVGDIVWGPHGNFPSWPGRLIECIDDEDENTFRVCWYGSKEISEVSSKDLKNLSDGLETHHRERKKLRKGRKMNASLERAIQEAMADLDN